MMPYDGHILNPVIANIQLDADKSDITSPDLTPSITSPKIRFPGHSVAAADVEMAEPPMLNTQPEGVSSLASTQ